MSDTALPKEIEKVRVNRVSTIEGLDSLDFTNLTISILGGNIYSFF